MLKLHFDYSKIGLVLLLVFLISNSTISSNKLIIYQSASIERSVQQTTTLSVLVVLMELPDDPHHESHTKAYYESLFFSASGSLSVAEYFQNTTYGTVYLTGTVLGWYEAENELSYYGAGNRISPGTDTQPQQLADEARINAQNDGYHPLSFDLFIVIHSGDGQEYSGNSNDIWSHAWSFWFEDDDGWKILEYTMNHEFVDYETPSHELGHALNFPDLYDHRYYQNEFAGPYAMMDGGPGHFSIWNKYYGHVSKAESPELLSQVHRRQIINYSEDSIYTVNPIAMKEPNGTMWLEIGWNSSGYQNPIYGKGWTVTVRENMDFDKFLPKHGVVIARIQVGPRESSQTQVSLSEYPPWNVVDSHPETEQNKDDAAFSLTDGDICSYSSNEGWAVQLIEKYANYSYRIRVTNASNIPDVNLITVNDSISGIYPLKVITSSKIGNFIQFAEISIDNREWIPIESIPGEIGNFTFNWDTTQEREGSHLIRARAKDNSTIPYIGHSIFTVIEINNSKGSILVIDDDLGRRSEEPILEALDSLGYDGEYEIIQTTSFSEAEITAESMFEYDYVFWIGNPSITPLSNSHINTAEFNEIRRYVHQATLEKPGKIIFMSSYNIFDLSNQAGVNSQQVTEIFKASSPLNFRSPVNLLQGSHFLENLPHFTLGDTSTLRSNRSADGEVVNLLPGAIPILKDLSPEFAGYDTKGYVVQDGFIKFVNYLFQPEMVPESILPILIENTLTFLASDEKLITQTTTTRRTDPILNLEDFLIPIGIFIAAVGAVGTVYSRRGARKPTEKAESTSYWLRAKEE